MNFISRYFKERELETLEAEVEDYPEKMERIVQLKKELGLE